MRTEAYSCMVLPRVPHAAVAVLLRLNYGATTPPTFSDHHRMVPISITFRSLLDVARADSQYI